MFRFHLIEESDPLWRTRWYNLVLNFLNHHPWRTDESEDADFLIPTLDTAMETNWPAYGAHDQGFIHGNFSLFSEHLDRKLSEISLLGLRGRLLLFNMNPFWQISSAVRGADRIGLIANSFHHSEYRPGVDVSFPTSAIIQFNRTTVDSNENTLLASFAGHESHPVRTELSRLHNGGDVIVYNTADRRHLGRVSTATSLDQDEVRAFAALLLRSRFAFVPRGDALFSYRLAEAMAAGAVPVIFSDGWVLPFTELLDWREFSLHLPEAAVPDCLDVLRAIPDRTVLDMRRKALQIFHQYFGSIETQMSWLFRLLDRRLETCGRRVDGRRHPRAGRRKKCQ